MQVDPAGQIRDTTTHKLNQPGDFTHPPYQMLYQQLGVC
jgi:hypothetical protein